ncbi:MAG TPA: DUF1697 domain-containing protein [Chloroflexota bacterium]|nr:DUF1697 domain-containing protein [Chloroflexota bacterium]
MAEGTRAGRYVALLRGINLGGKNKVPMATLSAMFVDLGCTDVETYIQSGNVVYTATNQVAGRVARRIPEMIHEQLGLKVPVITRTVAELREAVENNPFLKEGADEATLHLVFLGDEPTEQQVAVLDPERSPGDRSAVRGREVYLFCPNGLARTKLTNAYFDSQLKTVSTVRNWRTVLALVHMAEGGITSTGLPRPVSLR